MKELLETAMDLETAAHRLVALIESQEAEPIRESRDGVNWRFMCVCGKAVDYPDKYCRECGRRIRW